MHIEPCANGAELCEIIGELRKRKHEKEFIAKIIEKRDKQLFPRDLLVAYVPTKRGALRAAGLLKRSLKFDERRGSHLCIDFVWVLSDFRRLGIGRRLLMEGLLAGRPKAVRLLVAGSENNYRAVGLYESLGFRWVDRNMNDMMLEAEQVVALMAAASSDGASSDGGSSGGGGSSGSTGSSGSSDNSGSSGGGSGSSGGTHASAVAVTAATAAEAQAQAIADDLPVVENPDLHPNPAPVPSGHAEAEQLMTSVPSFSSVIELGDLMAAAELAAEPAGARKGSEVSEVPAVPLPRRV
jgi:ribosomal protein S18 acetylase RimI-like enzyme